MSRIRNTVKTYIAVFICAVLLVFIVVLSVLTMKMHGSSDEQRDYTTGERRYHIVVTGTSENEVFLEEVYKGAAAVSQNYNAMVELHVPESKAEDVSLQSLLDYVSFVNADGVIIYVNSENSHIVPPVGPDGKRIPFISLGHYDPTIPEVSFIGVNYSELGLMLSREILSYLGGTGSLLIVNTDNKNSLNYSMLMNTLLNSMEKNSSIVTEMINFGVMQNLSVEDRIRQEIVTSDNINLIVCLTEDDTIRVAQTVTDLNKVGKIGIIGFGESSDALLYYKKGIISVMLSLNPDKIGKTAVQELFEYMKKGYANSYIVADVHVLRGKQHL